MIDSGSMVSVLPYQVGLKLGGKWGAGKPLKLTGNLARLPAFPLLLKASIEGFDPVALAFAWTLFEDAPLLLGQMNFFSLFDVSFSGSRQTLRLKRSTVATLLPLP
ncbi:MAG: hypothetical protein ACKVY0_06145 [Prosthecobacter sp.]